MENEELRNMDLWSAVTKTLHADVKRIAKKRRRSISTLVEMAMIDLVLKDKAEKGD